MIFRIAIWNRNIFVSSIAVGAWLGVLALNIRSRSCIPSRFPYHLIFLACACERLDSRELYRGSHVRTDAHTKSNKFETTYSPIVDICIILHTHRGLANALAILVVDALLLLIMLVGLLRHPLRSSTGMWNFLYQQVTLVRFSPTCVGC